MSLTSAASGMAGPSRWARPLLCPSAELCTVICGPTGLLLALHCTRSLGGRGMQSLWHFWLACVDRQTFALKQGEDTVW